MTLMFFLFWIGHVEATVKSAFANSLGFLYAALGLETNQFALYSSRFVNLEYRILYCALCITLIHFIFNKLSVTKIVLALYTVVLSLTFLLYITAEVFQIEPLHIVAFRIDTLVVSPMPVVLIVAASKIK